MGLNSFLRSPRFHSLCIAILEYLLLVVTSDDVPHNRRLPDSIVITITEIDTRPKRPRDVELTATDENEDELHVII